MQEAKFDFNESSLGGERGKRQHSLQPRLPGRTRRPRSLSSHLWGQGTVLEGGQTLRLPAGLEGNVELVLARIHLKLRRFLPKLCPAVDVGRGLGSTSWPLTALGGRLSLPRATAQAAALVLKFPSISLNLTSRQGSEASKQPVCSERRHWACSHFRGEGTCGEVFWKAGLASAAAVTFCREGRELLLRPHRG